MSDDIPLQVALALSLQLSPKDRLKLVELLLSSLEQQMESKPTTGKAHWDKDILALLDGLDISDWETVGIHDPVKWVNKLRRKGD